MHIPTRQQPARPQLSLRVTPEQRARLRTLAAQNRVSLSRVLEYAVEELLAEAEKAAVQPPVPDTGAKPPTIAVAPAELAPAAPREGPLDGAPSAGDAAPPDA